MQVVVLLLAGCDAGSWQRTQTVCGFTETPIDAASFVTPPVYPSTECVDAVVEDFGVDVEGLLAEDGLTHPYGLVFGEESGDSSFGRLLWAAHALITSDLGGIDELDGQWASSPFRRALAGPGLAPVNERLYDYVTARVASTRLGRREDAAAGLQGDTLFLYDLPAGIDGAAVLVHEARHRDGFDHVACGGESVCDTSADGSWGFELAVHELARDHSDDLLARQIEQSWLDALPDRIVQLPSLGD